jgi:hypothetical protein
VKNMTFWGEKYNVNVMLAAQSEKLRDIKAILKTTRLLLIIRRGREDDD